MFEHTETMLVSTGALLLGIAAFMGFAQARTPRGSEREARFRVVHNGGTAGGVQLLALAGVWPRLAGDVQAARFIALAIVIASWAFFVGPLLTALARVRFGRYVLLGGAVVSVPAYAGLLVLALAASAPG